MGRGRKRVASPSTDAPLLKKKNKENAPEPRGYYPHMTTRAHGRSHTRRDDIHKINMTNSSPLRLPAKIRNIIYTYVFSGKEHNFRVTCDNCIASKNCEYCEDCDGHFKVCLDSFNNSDLGLLLVSRLVHAETVVLPYVLSKFEITFHWRRSFGCLGWFLKSRTEQQIQANGDIKVFTGCYKVYEEHKRFAQWLTSIRDSRTISFLRDD